MMTIERPVPAELLDTNNTLVLELPDAIPARNVRGDVVAGLRCEWIELVLADAQAGGVAVADRIFAATFETGELDDWSWATVNAR